MFEIGLVLSAVCLASYTGRLQFDCSYGQTTLVFIRPFSPLKTLADKRAVYLSSNTFLLSRSEAALAEQHIGLPVRLY